MKIGLSVLLALLPLAPAVRSSPNAGDIDFSALANLPAPSVVPVDVVYSTVNLARVATSLAAQQTLTAQGSIPTATPLNRRQLSKRQTSSCQQFSSFAQPNSSVPDTAEGFQQYFSDASISLDGYGMPIYEGVNSVGPKNGLLGINTYSDYNISTCKAQCDSNGSCQSFAIFRERVPQQLYDPTSCPDPSMDAAYQVKCLFYAFLLQTTDATRDGQWTNNGSFHVVSTSVKFFNKASYVPTTVPGFNSPTGGYGTCAPQATAADQHTVVTATGTYVVDALARTPGPMNTVVDPNFCMDQCNSITASTTTDQYGIKLNCKMFSLFVIRNNGNDYWQCQYWTQDLPVSQNTNCGGDVVVASWKYNLIGNVASYINTDPPLSR